MHPTLKRRTGAQGEAILAGIKYLRSIDNRNFSMGVTLWHTAGPKPISKSTICGCISGNILLADEPGGTMRDIDSRNAMAHAADLIGLTEHQRMTLFKPVHKYAHWMESIETAPGHITKYHATLVLAYFYFRGVIEWKKAKVYQWLFDNDDKNISGVWK